MSSTWMIYSLSLTLFNISQFRVATRTLHTHHMGKNKSERFRWLLVECAAACTFSVFSNFQLVASESRQYECTSRFLRLNKEVVCEILWDNKKKKSRRRRRANIELSNVVVFSVDGWIGINVIQKWKIATREKEIKRKRKMTWENLQADDGVVELATKKKKKKCHHSESQWSGKVDEIN